MNHSTYLSYLGVEYLVMFLPYGACQGRRLRMLDLISLPCWNHPPKMPCQSLTRERQLDSKAHQRLLCHHPRPRKDVEEMFNSHELKVIRNLVGKMRVLYSSQRICKLDSRVQWVILIEFTVHIQRHYETIWGSKKAQHNARYSQLLSIQEHCVSPLCEATHTQLTTMHSWPLVAGCLGQRRSQLERLSGCNCFGHRQKASADYIPVLESMEPAP